jgi:hypothetical protein
LSDCQVSCNIVSKNYLKVRGSSINFVLKVANIRNYFCSVNDNLSAR